MWCIFSLITLKHLRRWPVIGLLLWAALAGALLTPSQAAASGGNLGGGGDALLRGRVSFQGEDVFLGGYNKLLNPTLASAPVEPLALTDVILGNQQGLRQPNFAPAPVEPQALPDVFLGNQQGLRQPNFSPAPVEPQALPDVFLGNYDARIFSGLLPLGGICGDQNNDRLVNVLDVIIDLQITMGQVRATLPHRVLSDLNGDLRVNVFDAIIALRHIVGSLEIGRRCGPLPG